MEKELKTILAQDSIPDDLTIIYDDRHGLWGGTAIIVRGYGSLERQTTRAGSSETESLRKTIDRRALSDLIELLIMLTAWEQHTPESPPLPDESRAHLTISLQGKVSTIWERFLEMPEKNRLIRIRMLMEQLANA